MNAATKTYTPLGGSVPFKTLEYFATNPDEELTRDDIALKLGKPAKQVHSLLALAVSAGFLSRSENEDGEIIYRRGPVASGVTANASAHPTLKTSSSPSPSAIAQRQPSKRRSLVAIDVSAVMIEAGPPPPSSTSGNATNWPALFNRMKPGESCLLPIGCRYVLSKACTEYKKSGKGALTMRATDDETLRLWRLS